jgi:hypothetical protein
MRHPTLVALRTLAIAAIGLSACADDGGPSEATAAACGNRQDDDGDGFTDCADQDCWQFSACSGAERDTSSDTASEPDVPSDIRADAVTDTRTDVGTDIRPDAEACDPCGDKGSVKGTVCAPNSEVFVNDATVWVEGTGCNGEAFRVETTSAFDGSYYLLDVPCGSHTLRIEKGSFRASFPVAVQGGALLDVTGAGQKLCFGAGAAKIAVLDGTYDDLAGLLDALGLRYDYFNDDGDEGADGPTVELLADPARLATYDIIFAECGGTLGWLPQDAPLVMPNIKDFVLRGGALYMSDYAWVLGEWSFPDKVEWHGSDDPAGMGQSGSPQVIPSDTQVSATIADGNLAGYLGKTTIPITFDRGPQIAPEAVENGAFAHVVGTINVPFSFNIPNAPLALSYVPAQGAGRVIYTNFHNDAQTTSDMLTILRYLVFTL